MTAATMADPWEELATEAAAIVAAAAERGVTLRVVGSAGIRLHCPAPGPLMDRLGRPAKDIDLIVPQRHRKGMRRLLEERGYMVDRDLLIAMEGARYSFEHREHGIQLDVFVERLDFCHTIQVAGRLSAHPVTIPIEELLLQKAQIVDMTTTDLIDAGVLLATHEVAVAGEEPAAAGDTGGPARGTGPGERVDAIHIARLLAKDWGFHHTATRNLERIRRSVTAGGTGPAGGADPAEGTGPTVGAGPLIDVGEEGIAQVQRGTGRLLDAIAAEPKTLAWRMRDKIGERKQWWQDVDDREATY
jgi:hypothetical protein